MVSKARFALLTLVLLAGGTEAQTAGGGVAAGIGRTVEAAGRSAAARDLQNKIGSTLVRAVSRGKTAPRKVTPASKPKTQKISPSAPEPVDGSAVYFKPDPRVDSMAMIAEELGTNPSDRQQLRQLFDATKKAFEKEVAAKGRSNNLPAAFTFFIASTVTVYRDDPEPSDQAIDSLWDGLNGTLTESPEMSKLSDAEKQQLYDMLVAFSGFVLAGYMESKSSGDAETLKVFQTLSGELIRTVLKTNPATLKFSKSGLDIVS